MNVYEPTFLVTIEGQALSRDLTQEITSFVFEDNEEESDLLELSLTNRNGQFTDDPLFQEGNVIDVKFGYVGNLSPTRKCVIKEMTYDFPAGIPTLQIKAFNNGSNINMIPNKYIIGNVPMAQQSGTGIFSFFCPSSSLLRRISRFQDLSFHLR